MNKLLSKIWGKVRGDNLTDTPVKAGFSETREVASTNNREVICPNCASEKVIRRGFRQKKLEKVQLFQCMACNKSFTPETIKGKRFPAKVIIEGLNFYNLGFSLKTTCELLGQKFGINGQVSTSALGSWVTQYSGLCRYARLRPYAVKMCRPQETVEVTTLAHRQLYRFRYHRPKLKLIISEHYKHRKFEPLMDYLGSISAETPHHYFQTGVRISEIRTKFNRAQMIVRSKKNYANELARFVLQAVKENKQRHEEIQRFMIANDSVTVATEVPVYIRKEDIEHMQNQLNFKVIDEDLIVKGNKKVSGKMLLTGHIDILQVRNGLCHIMDYKPNAAKEKPIEQLTWYALALSRLTGLRLYEFKCAWFDEKNYFEFYPLHVVKKIQNRKRKKVGFKSGIVVEIPVENKLTVI